MTIHDNSVELAQQLIVVTKLEDQLNNLLGIVKQLQEEITKLKDISHQVEDSPCTVSRLDYVKQMDIIVDWEHRARGEGDGAD